MIKLNGQIVEAGHFPDGTTLMKQKISHDIYQNGAKIEWFFENNEELIILIYLTQHLRTNGVKDICLNLPYIPNARQDRVKSAEDVFTLKYFADIINYLDFNQVQVLDPHSNVSEALINNICVQYPDIYSNKALDKIGVEELDNIMVDFSHTLKKKYSLTMFYPDEGSVKRYASKSGLPYAFGIKKRDWETGVIEGLDVAGAVDQIVGRDILIVDDISSRGGTFYHSAKKLKELGANKIYLYVTHCENTILEGDLLTSGLIEKVYTTNSIFTKEHEKIEVFEL